MTDLSHPILHESEIRCLILQYRAGDNSAAERIIAHNEKLIYTLARRYFVTGVCGDTQMDDLMQLGRMGLLRALEDFDLESGNKFTTYAWQWIRQTISRNGRREGQQISMSYRANEQRGTVGMKIAEFVQKNSREPNTSELTQITGFSASYLSKIRSPVTSLDAPIGASFSNPSALPTFGEILSSETGDPSVECEDNLIFHAVLQNIKKMPVRTRKILIRFYGLDGKPSETMRQIAARTHITYQRVQQIIVAAIAELKRQNY